MRNSVTVNSSRLTTGKTRPAHCFIYIYIYLVYIYIAYYHCSYWLGRFRIPVRTTSRPGSKEAHSHTCSQKFNIQIGSIVNAFLLFPYTSILMDDALSRQGFRFPGPFQLFKRSSTLHILFFSQFSDPGPALIIDSNETSYYFQSTSSTYGDSR